MTQKEEEGKELHDFNDIESRELRDYNRGAVLANIHEQYVTDGVLQGGVLRQWLEAINSYLNRIPSDEHQSAKDAMSLHLTKRGFNYEQRPA